MVSLKKVLDSPIAILINYRGKVFIHGRMLVIAILINYITWTIPNFVVVTLPVQLHQDNSSSTHYVGKIESVMFPTKSHTKLYVVTFPP
jgi:hypothetical protein